nr:hypothetical protein DWUX_91 [Desulfovibrio diazotrophicus]
MPFHVILHNNARVLYFTYASLTFTLEKKLRIFYLFFVARRLSTP